MYIYKYRLTYTIYFTSPSPLHRGHTQGAAFKTFPSAVLKSLQSSRTRTLRVEAMDSGTASYLAPENAESKMRKRWESKMGNITENHRKSMEKLWLYNY